MSKQTIAAIREAERSAERIRSESVTRAAQMVANEKAAGERLLADTEARTRQEMNANFRALSERTEALLEKNRAEAEEETADIRKTAQLRMRGAINEIFRGLDKQCQ
ncbi:MAG: hypothetical protein IJX46_06000 [Clostridia bacterium]|nr:hypothetical protein [Clostridia bacterium]